MIQIKYGKSYGDATCEYLITYSDGMTVRDFITEWLQNEREWGYFGIYDGQSIFGNPRCEYSHGIIKGKPLPKQYLNKKIVKVTGSGGWTRSDFKFTV